MIGEFKKSVTKNFKLPEYCSGFELFLNNMFSSANETKDVFIDYKPLSRYPSTQRDVCFQVSGDMQYGHLISQIEKYLKTIKLESQILPVDIYQLKNNKNVKNITVRIKLTSHDHTLTNEDVTEIINQLIKSITSEIKVSVI